MIIKNVDYQKNRYYSIGTASKKVSMPEVAFAGKSSVGKSSLINESDGPEIPGKKTCAQPG